MTKINIFSGFLGAGKTTLIKALLGKAFAGERLVLIENEFGEIGVDGGFLQEAGIEITEMNSGCICCSLVGDFSRALAEVLERYHPDRILIEPSGVGKLSDVIRAVENASDALKITGAVAVVDAGQSRMYMKYFGEFFGDQIQSASTVFLSHTKALSAERIEKAVALIREQNPSALIVTTDWSELSAEQLAAAVECRDTLTDAMEQLKNEAVCPVCGHHHHDHHHHDHDEHCECGHDHHHHHHADEVFTSCGAETAKLFDAQDIKKALAALEDEKTYGMVLRAKGILPATDGSWIHFDYVPGEGDVRSGAACVTGRLCVIGAGLKIDALSALFGTELK